MSELSRSSPRYNALKAILRSMPDRLGYDSFEEARNLWKTEKVTAVDAVHYIISAVPRDLRLSDYWKFYEILDDEAACCAFLDSGLVGPKE